MRDALVIVPTYEEADNLERLVDGIRAQAPEAHVLVVDDNSPDGTGDVADRIAAADPHVSVLHRSRKEGLGAAYRAGFRWGMARGHDVLVEMDADGSHRAADLPLLLGAVSDGADLAIGSRWVPGGRVVNWPWYRRLISRGGTWYARRMLALPVADATAGFRAFRRATLERVDLASVASQGYCFQIDMTRRVVDLGLRITEVPITFVERDRGTSKMSGAIVREALWRVTWWGLRRRLGR